jgi:hypothetical protein
MMELFPGTVSLQTQSDKHLQFTPSVTSIRSRNINRASRLCNSDILSRCEHLISFAFHDSVVVLEAASEAKSLNKLVTLLYLD